MIFSLFSNHIVNFIPKLGTKLKFPCLLISLFSFFFSTYFTSCSDDIVAPENGSGITASGEIKVIELPGIYGIGIRETDNEASRADNSTSTSDGNSLFDGSFSEYELIDTNIQTDKATEFYHYLLLYNTTSNNSKPLIFPIDVSGNVTDPNPYNNLTLTISKIISTGSEDELTNSKTFKDIDNYSEFAELIQNSQPYVLLNFKLIDGEKSNYSLDGNLITIPGKSNTSTAEKLGTLTRAQLEKLQMLDYKIKGQKAITGGGNNGTPSTYDASFLMMSSSVYSNGSKKIVDGTFDTSKIFTTEQEAKTNPGGNIYVERLASKITVNFNIAEMAKAQFGFVDSNSGVTDSGDNLPKNNTEKAAPETVSVEFDPKTGLPVIHLKVRKVDMSHTGGIKFDETGYTIMTNPMDATIRIVGFGVSNVESQTNLFKYVKNTYDAQWNWRDVSNHRCYWSEDSHYELERAGGLFTKTKGYPHQFRLALDTDSVTSYHAGPNRGYMDYSDTPYEEFYIGNDKYISYNKLGTIDPSQVIDGVYLNYKSFASLEEEFKKLTFTKNSSSTYSYDPIYSLENTYFDPGMTNSAWRWQWQRVPYAAATNLILMAVIEIDDNVSSESGSQNGENNGEDPQLLSSRADEDSKETRTLYFGQNNIFYLKVENLLKSKLAILNQVMLSGGNAGLQILHGQWDRHTRWDDDDENQYKDTHLDKVAWNEGSVLWFAKVALNQDGNPKYTTTEGKDADGNVIEIKKVILEDDGQIQLKVDDNITKYLTLIPAEISGGDGQRLIAPAENYMGKEYRYYLAPPLTGEDGKEKMDEDKAVEISFNHLVALIHKIIGPVDVYRNGKMYYSVPIPHRVLNYGPTSNIRAWATIGSFGIIRNNWYSITVDQISKLGTPIDDPNQPIVPVMDVKRSYINMGVKLKDWHEIIQDNIPMM